MDRSGAERNHRLTPLQELCVAPWSVTVTVTGKLPAAEAHGYGSVLATELTRR